MSEENANVGETAETTESTDTSKMVTEKISEYSGKVDALVESALGIIGNRPWDSWLGTANKYISKFLPAAIALAGVLACLTGLVTMIKNDAPFSYHDREGPGGHRRSDRDLHHGLRRRSGKSGQHAERKRRDEELCDYLHLE